MKESEREHGSVVLEGVLTLFLHNFILSSMNPARVPKELIAAHEAFLAHDTSPRLLLYVCLLVFAEI